MVEKTRTDLLNFLAEKYNLQRYLEIGVQNKEQNFNKIICHEKYSVDPDPMAVARFCMTSDQFFEAHLWNCPEYTFDLIFIDGLHTAEQVKKDFENALKILSPGGFIVLHDCNPLKEEHTIVPRPTKTGHWNGDVYRFAISIEDKVTVDIDNGCLVYNRHESAAQINTKYCKWKDFDTHRKNLLNLISWDEFVLSHSHV